MSQENVDAIARLHEAYHGSDFDGVVEAIFDPACSWGPSEAFGVLHGPQAIIEYLRDFATSFDDCNIVAVR